MAPVAFEVREVSFRYDRTVTALDNLSLQIEEGRRVVLLGANGSGKSTLLRLLDGLCLPDAGAIRFHGDELTPKRLRDDGFLASFRRRVGLVFQNPDVQLFNSTVFDEVAFGPLQMRWPEPEVRDKVEHAMEAMGVAHLRERAPHRLSGGEKKRVALASVLVLDPEVLLLDEPTSGLDPKSQSQIIDLLAAEHTHRTVIAATHDLGVVEHIADECFVMESGRLLAHGATDEILSDIPLLQHASLVHAHRHKHGAVVHSHPHQHGHGEHEH